MTLMHNSHPTRKALRNTSGGISQLKNYSQVAVIRAVEYSYSHGTTVHDVEFMFPNDEDDDNNDNNDGENPFKSNGSIYLARTSVFQISVAVLD
jgi:hypothetical protein